MPEKRKRLSETVVVFQVPAVSIFLFPTDSQEPVFFCDVARDDCTASKAYQSSREFVMNSFFYSQRRKLDESIILRIAVNHAVFAACRVHVRQWLEIRIDNEGNAADSALPVLPLVYTIS